MSLLDCTHRIVDLTEKLSGRPVRIQEDPTLSVLATVSIARGNAPMHLIRYRPIRGRQPDYHICYQCGFIIRLFETPPEARSDFAQSPEASGHMDALLANRSLGSNIRSAKEMLLNGLLIQLRSVPIGLRVDDWLWTTCADVRDEQIASSRIQLQDNAQVLTPAVRHSFPKKVVYANTAMNAAFALYWATKLNDESISLPYRSVGAAANGEALLDIFRSLEPSPSRDRELVDRWAEQLGLAGWYMWKPYKLDE
jgi:hypothetical protein